MARTGTFDNLTETEIAKLHEIEDSQLRVGQHVMCNGYKAVISSHYAPGLWEVRFDRGCVCASASELLNPLFNTLLAAGQ